MDEDTKRQDAVPEVSPETVQETPLAPGPAQEVPEHPAETLSGTETGAEPVTEVPLEDPVEILVGLAEKGEIDPWNINIIEVTDRFLSELDHRRQLNLQVSGRTLFYAATLLRMKSEALAIVEPAPEEDEGGADDLFGDDFGSSDGGDIGYSSRLGIIDRLEHEIQRRLDRKNLRKSPVTLFELITELKNIEREERRRRRMSSDTGDGFLIDADDVVSIAHEEGFQESSMLRLAEYLEGMELDEEMTLRELCERMDWGIPEVFIPLLFLALDGRCTLRQEEFYGDIWVRICRTEKAEPAENSTI